MSHMGNLTITFMLVRGQKGADYFCDPFDKKHDLENYSSRYMPRVHFWGKGDHFGTKILNSFCL